METEDADTPQQGESFSLPPFPAAPDSLDRRQRRVHQKLRKVYENDGPSWKRKDLLGFLDLLPTLERAPWYISNNRFYIVIMAGALKPTWPLVVFLMVSYKEAARFSRAREFVAKLATSFPGADLRVHEYRWHDHYLLKPDMDIEDETEELLARTALLSLNPEPATKGKLLIPNLKPLMHAQRTSTLSVLALTMKLATSSAETTRRQRHLEERRARKTSKLVSMSERGPARGGTKTRHRAPVAHRTLTPCRHAVPSMARHGQVPTPAPDASQQSHQGRAATRERIDLALRERQQRDGYLWLDE